MVDEYGVDTVSLGSTLAFAMEATEKKLLKDGIRWGDFDKAKMLAEDITTVEDSEDYRLRKL